MAATDRSNPPRIVIRSTPAVLARRLWLLGIVFVTLNVGAYIAVRFARHHNLDIRDGDTSLTLPHELLERLDPHQAKMTDAFFDQSCEIGHFEPCVPVESDVVELLRRQVLPPVASQLLKEYKYSSAYHLLKDLSMRGADREVIRISAISVFDIHSLTRFSVDWYLDPAMYYASHNREQDAIPLFRAFLAIMMGQVEAGHWLSQEGVDATDLPVIVHLFCESGDLLTETLCLTGILKALYRADVRVEQDASRSVPPGSAVLARTDKFSDAYEGLPQALRSVSLTAYLRVWTWDGAGSAPRVPPMMNPGQQAAWHYAVGVVLRRRAKRSAKRDECNEILKKSDQAFAQSIRARHDGYLAPAAERHRQDIATLSEELCGQQKNSNE